MTSDPRAIRVLYEQFHVLRAEAEKIEPETAGRTGSTGITVVIRWFNRLLEQANALLDGDPALLTSIAAVQPIPEFRESFHAIYHRTAQQEIVLGTNMVLQALGLVLIGGGAVASAIAVEREGLFLTGQHFDAMQLAWKILSQAQRSILIVDGYIDHRVLDLLKGKGESVNVAILTKPTVPSEIAPLASAFNKQYGQKGVLSIRSSNVFHDRFVIVDDRDVYHFGASLKDLGTRGSMFSRIEEPLVIEVLRNQLADVWKDATVVV